VDFHGLLARLACGLKSFSWRLMYMYFIINLSCRFCLHYTNVKGSFGKLRFWELWIHKVHGLSGKVNILHALCCLTSSLACFSNFRISLVRYMAYFSYSLTLGSFGWGVSEKKIKMWHSQTTDAKLTLPLARWAKNGEAIRHLGLGLQIGVKYIQAGVNCKS
jgi:hypothetical protein